MALDVDRVRVASVWFRHLPHRGSVWWRSDPPPDGRWQRGSAIAGFYLADSRETAWAGWYRQIDELALRTADQLPRVGLTRPRPSPASGEILCLFRDRAEVAGVKALPPPAIQLNPPPRA
ncbi:MAG TPA: hypothetical protein VG898_11120 [Solirubrobacterales bacterium]|nr:hypothetical protein [Solirubrobacterales bacterium]